MSAQAIAGIAGGLTAAALKSFASRSGTNIANRLTGRKRKRRRNSGAEALRIVKRLKRNIEVKSIFYNLGIAITPDEIEINDLGVDLPSGTANGQRIGNKVMIKSMSCRWELTLAGSETAGTLIRVIHIYDRHPHGLLATTADILEDVTNGERAIISPYQQTVNVETVGRFQILQDRTIAFDGTQFHFADKFFIRKPMEVLYDGSLGTLVDTTKGRFLRLHAAFGNSGVALLSSSGIFKYTDA